MLVAVFSGSGGAGSRCLVVLGVLVAVFMVLAVLVARV